MTAQTFFISDLHLHQSRPNVTENFFQFLEKEAPAAEALYILGDFFEVWAGDDDPNPHHKKVMQALGHFSQKNKTPIYFMRGNRDFLIDKGFAKATGCILIPDPTTIELYGEKILLMHGDSLCTGDRSHQRFRKFSQHPIIRKLFLMLLPFSWRLKIASGIRKNSQKAGAERERKMLLEEHSNNNIRSDSNLDLSLSAGSSSSSGSSSISSSSSNPSLNLNECAKKQTNLFDVNQQAVEKALLQSQANYLIHGHTHKPGIHEFTLDNIKKKRIVLGEWGAYGNVLVYSKDFVGLKNFPE